MTVCILDTIATFAPGDCEGCGRLLQPRLDGKVDFVQNYGSVGLKICYKCYRKIIYTPKRMEQRHQGKLESARNYRASEGA